MKEWFIKLLKDWAESIAEAIVIIIALYILLWPIKIQGTSMESAVNDGDWVLGCRFAAMVSEPKTGDIVLFKVDDVEGQMIKRVVGVSGDTVEIKDGLVFINGRELAEKYREGSTNGEFSTVVRDGYFFALGDNRDTSTDSRNFGQVPVKSVKSKIFFRFYPFNDVYAYFLDAGSSFKSSSDSSDQQTQARQ